MTAFSTLQQQQFVQPPLPPTPMQQQQLQQQLQQQQLNMGIKPVGSTRYDWKTQIVLEIFSKYPFEKSKH